MRYWIVAVVLMVWAGFPAEAQQVYLSNRPFQGSVETVDGKLRVELEPFVKALGFELTELNGVYHVIRPGQPRCPNEANEPRGLYYSGCRVESARLDGPSPTAGLEDLSAAMKARVVANPELGTIDVYKPAEMTDTEAGFRLIGFCNSGDQQRLRDALDRFPEAEVSVVDVTDRQSTGFQTYGDYFQMGAIPYTVLVDPAGRVVGEYTGYPTAQQIGKDHARRIAQRDQVNRRALQSNRTARRMVGGGGGGG